MLEVFAASFRGTPAMPKLFPIILAAVLAVAAHAATISESSRHDIATGPWGVAWINGGDVMRSNGIDTTTTLIPSANAAKIIGADVTGDGLQEIVFVANGGLYYYDFTTQATSGPFGSAINDLTAGKFLTTSTRDTVMVSNNLGNGGSFFAFDGGTNSFTSLGGSAIRSMARGNFTTTNSVDEFVVVNTSNQPLIFTPNGTGGGSFAGPILAAKLPPLAETSRLVPAMSFGCRKRTPRCSTWRIPRARR